MTWKKKSQWKIIEDAVFRDDSKHDWNIWLDDGNAVDITENDVALMEKF